MKNPIILNSCCFIGDYNQDSFPLINEVSPNYKDIKTKIDNVVTYLIEKLHVTNFISGMNIGFEHLCAETVINKKEKYPNITLEGVIPYEMHSINWTSSQRDKYYYIMERSDREFLLQYHYTTNCIKNRNKYMINKSKYIIYFRNNSSSIDNLVLYARSNNKIEFIINCDNVPFLGEAAHLLNIL